MTSDESNQAGSAVRWRSVYAAVVAFTVVLVALLYLFSHWFAG